MADFMSAIQMERGDADWSRLAGFMRDIADGTRTIWTAKRHDQYVGMITVRWQSDYAGFRAAPIAPEIIDLYVWRDYRRQGLAKDLLDSVEDKLRLRDFKRVGLGVGVLADDAPAYDLYLQRGYQFDGTGGWWQGQPVTEESVIDYTQTPVLLMMSKML